MSPEVTISQRARNALAARFKLRGMRALATFISSGSADSSTHTPALEALTEAYELLDAFADELTEATK